MQGVLCQRWWPTRKFVCQSGLMGTDIQRLPGTQSMSSNKDFFLHHKHSIVYLGLDLGRCFSTMGNQSNLLALQNN